MQLDIFEHSRDIMLRNDVLHALQHADAGTARRAWHALAGEYPQDRALAPLDRLVGTLEQPAEAPFASHPAATAALRAFCDEIEPAARQWFGAKDAADWLKPQWHRLAQRAEHLGFEPDAADAHAAPLYLRAGDAAAAAAAVAKIASWRRIPTPLAWMCEARWRLDGLDACWGLIAELAWLAPARLDALLQRRADPLLQRLRRQFDLCFEGSDDIADLGWFPAWVLTDKPALAPLLAQAQPGLQTEHERGMRLLLDVLHLERQGRQRELVERRRQLRDLQPLVFSAYMASR